ncbi:movement protein [Caucasus prunus virus]|uniref:Movement protein n=1 Tax=Caucasus prunus virus TaxID=1667230 RepID=A0A0H3YC05_9VIRU|nr:movement protein [Caucasus prunus virus]AKN08995.1 movement protein [Caucasus prunus virus]
MSKAIKVSSFVNRVNLDKSLLGSNEINALYGNGFAPLVFKDEIKMTIPGNVLGKPIKVQANVLTKKRLEQIRAQKFKGKACSYIHLGVVPIAIQSLLVSGHENVWGRCSLVDLSRGSEETALIDRFKFRFTNDEPYAAKILTINAAVDINCDTSVGSLQVLLEIHGIDVRSERSVAAITVGLSCVPTNNMVMLPGLKRSTPKWSLVNVFNVPEDSEAEKNAFENLFDAANPGLVDMGNDKLLETGKRMHLWGNSLKPVYRRELSTRNLIKEQLSHVMSETAKSLKSEGSISRCCSSRDVSQIGKEALHLQRGIRMGMEEFHRPRGSDASMGDGCWWRGKEFDTTFARAKGESFGGQAENFIRQHSRSLSRPINRLPEHGCELHETDSARCGWSAGDGGFIQPQNLCGKSEDTCSDTSGQENDGSDAKGSLPEFCKLCP